VGDAEPVDVRQASIFSKAPMIKATGLFMALFTVAS
jgi:hypothetical protein